jgi:hypothetical protein
VPGLVNTLWLLCTLLEVVVVVCAVAKGTFRRYLILNLYMAASVLISIGRYRILSHYGYRSSEYLYFYYYSDALLTIFLYFALTSLYAHVFSDLSASRLVRLGAVLLLAGTALFSYGVVQQSNAKLITHFVLELSQNLYFVGLVLTYVLWAAIMKLRESRTQLVQLVLSLGVYFSLFAATYALTNLYPAKRAVFLSFVQLFGFVLPLAWAYAFWKLNDNDRMQPARLALVPR